MGGWKSGRMSGLMPMDDSYLSAEPTGLSLGK